MDLLVQRKIFSDNSTIGDLLINGEKFCNTLEPRKDQSKGKPYLTPAGTYEVKIFFSPKFNRKMPHVMDVPGFDAIEIHNGSLPANTHGCTMVGVYHPGTPDFINHSVDTFDKFYDLLVKEESGNKNTFITYVEVTA
jgi:hypothetical protein